MKIPTVLLLLFLATSLQAEPFQKAEVTRVVNKVSLLPNNQGSRSAKVGDSVAGRTALQTGSASRAELSFPDQTITRIGANALFRFESGGRSMDLEGGTMLFSSPKGMGGGQVQAGAVTAAVKGTTFLLSFKINGEVKVIVLEGKVLVFLTKFPGIRRMIRTGQMVIVPEGATKIPKPQTVELSRLLKTSRLLESGGFEPLFSQALLQSFADRQPGVLGPPNNPSLAQQAAQTTRNTTNKPMVKPPEPPKPPKPVPISTPIPKPPSKPRDVGTGPSQGE
jgi:hypothetical protein